MYTSVIKPYCVVDPKVYAYSTPNDISHKGWLKIGYTERRTVEERIRQQTHTSDSAFRVEWRQPARYTDGTGRTFRDTDFHSFLTEVKGVERKQGTEWFRIDNITSLVYINEFASGESAVDRAEYALRSEQESAAARTAERFASGGKRFLWNAKPRFGKTLTSYDLACRAGFASVLVVTNRPSIANSWCDDFFKFIEAKGKFDFVSETDALKGKPGVLDYEGFKAKNKARARAGERGRGIIAFESLQGLKGSKHFGGKYDKLDWIAARKWDLMIVDESQEGVDTMLTEKAFDNVKRKHTLYLSGTPFKALADGRFSAEEIFNWTYADEQEARADWTGDASNPYERMPKMNMFMYEMSQMVADEVARGIDLNGDGGAVEYAFDLAEFFATDRSGKFEHEDSVKKFLRVLRTGEKYPFSTPKLRDELKHTLWILNRVASAKALAKLLKEDEVFRDYEIVIAAGDGRASDIADETAAQSGDDKRQKASLDRVRKAIKEHAKTITLSVGQLTVGVTVPEWSAVMMLCNLKSASSYMQAAFRAQNPHTYMDGTEIYAKENAYVFDFDPARTLVIFDEFARNLSPRGRCSTAEEQEAAIGRLLNFFPVVGEDEQGRMVELDPRKVLSIPRRIKSREVVRQGFMCNYLFADISRVFGAPKIVQDIITTLTPALEEFRPKDRDTKDAELGKKLSECKVDEDGNPIVDEKEVRQKTEDLFGEKVREEIGKGIEEASEESRKELEKNEAEPRSVGRAYVDRVKTIVTQNTIDPLLASMSAKKQLTASAQKTVRKNMEQRLDDKLDPVAKRFEEDTRTIKEETAAKLRVASSERETEEILEESRRKNADAIQALNDSMQKIVDDNYREFTEELTRQSEERRAAEAKRAAENDTRARLRGFSRTIPSFIMAYGDDRLTLANFDEYTEDDVFHEVTGISLDDFRLLRDGGDVTAADGTVQHFDGHLFDEVVFNDSVRLFLKKKAELADYFDESATEDIFEYIPPQKTNQIFTPRRIVEQMADALEEENPGCFDDPEKTFADLYMKSGLFITEITKRLFRSARMKELFPDRKERITHILTRQVFGMAPSRIILLIAKNYILGFDEGVKILAAGNFVQADAAQAAKNGTLQELVDRHFGK